jgi:hypothetical protein
MHRLRGELDLSIVADVFGELIDQGVDPELLVATGFSQEEVDALVHAAQDASADILPESIDEPTDAASDGGSAKPYVLEVEFGDRESYQRARKGLRRAAGKGNELSTGLLRLLGEEAST